MFFLINADPVLSQEEMDEVAAKFYEFSHGSHPLVKIGSLAIMADPYYFHDSKLGQSARDRMAAEFPDLAVTQEALRQTLFTKRNDPPESLEAVLSGVTAKSADGSAESPARIFQAADPLTIRMRAAYALLRSPDRQGDAVSALCDDARAAPDWRMRYGLLQMAEPYREKGHRAPVKAMGEALAQRNEVTPEVTRAQCLLVEFAQQDGDSRVAQRLIDTLLQQRRTTDVLERNLYESVMQTIQIYADRQAEAGAAPDAVAALRKLAAKYPKSALEEKCAKRIAEWRPRHAP